MTDIDALRSLAAQHLKSVVGTLLPTSQIPLLQTVRSASTFSNVSISRHLSHLRLVACDKGTLLHSSKSLEAASHALYNSGYQLPLHVIFTHTVHVVQTRFLYQMRYLLSLMRTFCCSKAEVRRRENPIAT